MKDDRYERVEEILGEYRDELELSDEFVDDVCTHYIELSEKDMVSGQRRGYDTIVAAITMCMLRERDVPIEFRELAQMADVPTRNITRSYRMVARQLDFDITPVAVSGWVDRVATDVGFDEDHWVRRDALEIAENHIETGCTSRLRKNIAAAAVYLAIERSDELEYNRCDVHRPTNVGAHPFREAVREIQEAQE